MEAVCFELYTCSMEGTEGHIHDLMALENSCWDIDNPLEKCSEADGLVDFEDLLIGEYMLAEVRTLSGYALPQGQWYLHIKAANDIEITAKYRGLDAPPAFQNKVNGTEAVYVLENYKYTQLPGAGGRGILLMLIGGICIAALAMAGYWLKSRKEAFNNKQLHTRKER